MHKTLTGGQSRCSGCGLYFTSVSSFDFHRVGPYSARRCMTEAELRADGVTPNERGYWRKPAPAGIFSKYTAATA
jgi:hypothetical protein